MKCLTVTIDDRVLFSGEIAEYQVAESDEIISVTGRFRPAPGVMDNLMKLATAAKRPPEPNGSPRPTLDVVRDTDES